MMTIIFKEFTCKPGAGVLFVHKIICIQMNEFDAGLKVATIDAATVHSEHEITLNFKDGLEWDWKI